MKTSFQYTLYPWSRSTARSHVNSIRGVTVGSGSESESESESASESVPKLKLENTAAAAEVLNQFFNECAPPG
eukprot:gene16207-biopygen12790